MGNRSLGDLTEGRCHLPLLSEEAILGTATGGSGPRPFYAKPPNWRISMATLNHVGIAVNDIPRMRKLFAILDLKINHTEEVSEQGVITHFLPLPVEPGNLELLEVSDPTGPVGKFIDKKGPGIHHLSFEVESGKLSDICSKLRTAGFELIYSQPKAGAHGMRVNFIHPKSSGGILIEVMERGEYSSK